MTAMMGLTTRLKLAKVLCYTEALDSGDDLALRADELASARASLVILRPGHPGLLNVGRDRKLGEAFTVLHENSGFDAIVGTTDVDVAMAKKCDTVLSSKSVTAPHEFALIGREVSNERQLKDALSDDDVAYLVIDKSLVKRAAELAPATKLESKPWFVAGAQSVEDARELIGAGAIRLAVDVDALGRDAISIIKQQWTELAQAWRTPELEKLTFGSFRTDPGQQRRPGQEKQQWAGPNTGFSGGFFAAPKAAEAPKPAKPGAAGSTPAKRPSRNDAARKDGSDRDEIDYYD